MPRYWSGCKTGSMFFATMSIIYITRVFPENITWEFRWSYIFCYTQICWVFSPQVEPLTSKFSHQIFLGILKSFSTRAHSNNVYVEHWFCSVWFQSFWLGPSGTKVFFHKHWVPESNILAIVFWSFCNHYQYLQYLEA